MNSAGVDFERLVELHYAPLFRFAVSLVKQESEARDLLQETFLIWARKGHQLQDPTKAKTWLFTTLYREFLNRRRRNLRFEHVALEDADSELPVGTSESPHRQDWNSVSECLQELGPDFRAPISLFYLEEYSYAEIAAILRIPLGTVKSRIARGICHLQNRLNPSGTEERLNLS